MKEIYLTTCCTYIRLFKGLAANYSVWNERSEASSPMILYNCEALAISVDLNRSFTGPWLLSVSTVTRPVVRWRSSESRQFFLQSVTADTLHWRITIMNYSFLTTALDAGFVNRSYILHFFYCSKVNSANFISYQIALVTHNPSQVHIASIILLAVS